MIAFLEDGFFFSECEHFGYQGAPFSKIINVDTIYNNTELTRNYTCCKRNKIFVQLSLKYSVVLSPPRRWQPKECSFDFKLFPIWIFCCRNPAVVTYFSENWRILSNLIRITNLVSFAVDADVSLPCQRNKTNLENWERWMEDWGYQIPVCEVH